MLTDGSHFAGNWLTLREPVDHRSRAHGLTNLANRYLHREAAAPPTIIDLGAGRGSNLRYLNAYLDGPAHWRLLDHDSALLATAAASEYERDTVTTGIFDLSAPLEPMLADADLVSASALLDLVSADWIETFCSACSAAGAAVLMALSIDGQILFSDAEPLDARIRAAVALDQRRDKGLGPALGSAAPTVLVNSLTARGYAVTTKASDWHLDHTDAALAHALIDGWREAAQRQYPQSHAAIAGWAERRRTAVAEGRTRLIVGHVDVLGLPNPRP